MLNSIKAMYLKEILEVWRDRRSLVSVLILSMILPLSMLVSMHFSSSMENGAATAHYHIIGAENSPALVNFLENQGLTISSYEESDNKGTHIIIPDDYEQKLATGYLPTIIVRTDIAKSPSVTQRLEHALGKYAREIATGRLMARGIAPIILQPFKVDIQDTGEISMLTRYLAPAIIFVLLLAPVYALMPAAIDSTAGERERHGLFPLLLQPMPVLSIPIGKFLMLVTSGMAALTIAIITGFIGYSNFSIEGMNFGFDFSVLNGLVFLFVSLPAVMLLAAIMMAISSFAKSFKEGQTYAGVSTLIPILAIGAGFLFEEKSRGFIPFWSEVTVLSSVLSGDVISWMPWIVTSLAYMVIIALCMWWLSRSMRRNALQSQT